MPPNLYMDHLGERAAVGPSQAEVGLFAIDQPTPMHVLHRKEPTVVTRPRVMSVAMGRLKF